MSAERERLIEIAARAIVRSYRPELQLRLDNSRVREMAAAVIDALGIEQIKWAWRFTKRYGNEPTPGMWHFCENEPQLLDSPVRPSIAVPVFRLHGLELPAP